MQMLGALLVLGVGETAATPVDYTGHSLVRVIVSTPSHARALNDAQHQGRFDFLTGVRLGSLTELHITPEQRSEVDNFVAEHKLHVLSTHDLQEVISHESAAHHRRRAQELPFTSQYQDAHDTIAWTRALAKQYPSIASTFSIGQTYEGRDILVLRISGAEHTLTADGMGAFNGKPAYLMHALIHSRERLAGAAVAWIVEKMLQMYGTDEQVTRLVDSLDFYFIPVLNPDGVQYSHDVDRIWRMNRRPNTNETGGLLPDENYCWGVDPNRNFDYHFGLAGSSGVPCVSSQTYRGEYPFSEVESYSLASFVGVHGQVKAYIDLHTFAAMWITPGELFPPVPPLGSTPEPRAMEAAQAAVKAIEAVHGSDYYVGDSAPSHLLGPLTGTTSDYFYYKALIPYAYTVEASPADVLGGFNKDDGLYHDLKKSLGEEFVEKCLFANRLGFIYFLWDGNVEQFYDFLAQPLHANSSKQTYWDFADVDYLNDYYYSSEDPYPVKAPDPPDGTHATCMATVPSLEAFNASMTEVIASWRESWGGVGYWTFFAGFFPPEERIPWASEELMAGVLALADVVLADDTLFPACPATGLEEGATCSPGGSPQCATGLSCTCSAARRVLQFSSSPSCTCQK